MRVLTFPSYEVLDAVLTKGIYYADLSKCREKHNYKKDIEQLDGAVPIWCFAPIRQQEFEIEDFINGELFQTFKCEMSLTNSDGLFRFFMLELDVLEEEMKTGLSRNDYLGAKIISNISKEMLCAVYRLSYDSH